MRQGKQSVLFLCTRNQYRGRLAEALFNSVAARMGLQWQASSRGLVLDQPAAPGLATVDAVEALTRRGVLVVAELGRAPALATPEAIEKANRIVALNQSEHLPLLNERFPAWAEKVEFWHVASGAEAPDLIEREVMGLVARILGGHDRQPDDIPPNASLGVAVARSPIKKPVTVKVGREIAGRRGKGVTTLSGLPLDEGGLRDLATTLKNRCGTGGTVKDGRIEIQGDQRERIAAELEKMGYKVKRVGG